MITLISVVLEDRFCAFPLFCQSIVLKGLVFMMLPYGKPSPDGGSEPQPAAGSPLLAAASRVWRNAPTEMTSQRLRFLRCLRESFASPEVLGFPCCSSSVSKYEASRTSSKSIGSVGGCSGEVGASSDDSKWRDERLDAGKDDVRDCNRPRKI